MLLLSSCDKESKLSPTEDLGIVDMFSPDENADPRVKRCIMIMGFGFVLILAVLMN